jgi:hypothetical protein
MWDVLWNLGFFLVGMTIGKSSPESEGKVSDLYNKLNESQDLEQMLDSKWRDAELRAETWERRYNNLSSTIHWSKEKVNDLPL